MTTLAYLIKLDDEHGEIRFDDDGAELALAGYEPERLPQFDRFAPGPVPVSALLAAGWWYECGHCGHQVLADGCEECLDELGPEYREAGVADAMPPPVIDDERAEVFCSQTCAGAKREYWRKRKERKEAVRAACLAELANWPDAEIVTIWDGMRPGEESVDLRLPGISGTVTWRPKCPGMVEVAFRDRETFISMRNARHAREEARLRLALLEEEEKEAAT